MALLSNLLDRVANGGVARSASDFSAPSVDRLTFPPSFRFGAATAAHQVEGELANNNWAAWERTTRADGSPTIYTRETCGRAADHWRLFDEDVERMKDLRLSMYRFSVEWSRIEPRAGAFDERAMDRYREWCVALRAAGITPMVTLHHFTEPLWITHLGGFESKRTVAAFGRFVRFVAERLSDVVDHWITVNEPVVYALLGWGRGEFPPGKQDPPLMARVLEHLLLAHAEAYHILHEVDSADADGDGIAALVAPACNLVVFEPACRFNPIDIACARLLDRVYNRSVLDALETGRFQLYFPGTVRHEAHHDVLAGTWDFAAVNHYFRHLAGLRYLNCSRVPSGFDPRCDKNDMGWDLTPWSLYKAARLAAEYGMPIFITEHGSCDAAVPDLRRRRFLLESLQALSEAVRDGADVRGYLYWSLLDNFEWSHGFAPRFGLYRVDYQTQLRTLTETGRLYREVIRSHHLQDTTER